MTTEHDKAKQWRLAHNWSLDDLAELTGYSRTSIVFFERGINPLGKPIDEFAFYRFKKICHSIEAGLRDETFKWTAFGG